MWQKANYMEGEGACMVRWGGGGWWGGWSTMVRMRHPETDGGIPIHGQAACRK